MNETIQIFHEVGANIRQGSLGQDIATKVMEILEEIFIFVQELELSKLTIFLKWKFTSLKS